MASRQQEYRELDGAAESMLTPRSDAGLPWWLSTGTPVVPGAGAVSLWEPPLTLDSKSETPKELASGPLGTFFCQAGFPPAKANVRPMLRAGARGWTQLSPPDGENSKATGCRPDQLTMCQRR